MNNPRLQLRPASSHRGPRTGQALFELAITLIVFVALVIAACTFTDLSLTQLRLRRDVRAEAGQDALGRTEGGLVALPGLLRTDPEVLNEINAVNALGTTPLPFASTLSSSAYTLQAAQDPTDSLALKSFSQSKLLPLQDDLFIRLIYSKGNVRFTESVTFPAATGLWP